MRLIAFFTESASIKPVLLHLGLPDEAPSLRLPLISLYMQLNDDERVQREIRALQNDHPDEVGGVRIRPVPKATSRRDRMLRTAWQVYRAALDEKADLYHFHDPELLPIGMLLALRGRKVIYDAHEYLGETARTKRWIPGPLRRCASEATRAATSRWYSARASLTVTMKGISLGESARKLGGRVANSSRA